MRIVGLSAFYHDSAAALIEDGRVVAAAQEEPFSRKKHDARFPRHALDFCLAEAGTRLSEVDNVVFYDKPFLKFERLLETYLAFAPRGFGSFRLAIPLWLREKLFQKQLLRDELARYDANYDWEKRLLFCRAPPEPRRKARGAAPNFSIPASRTASARLLRAYCRRRFAKSRKVAAGRRRGAAILTESQPFAPRVLRRSLGLRRVSTAAPIEGGLRGGLLPVSWTPSLGVLMEPEVGHGTTEFQPRVQA